MFKKAFLAVWLIVMWAFIFSFIIKGAAPWSLFDGIASTIAKWLCLAIIMGGFIWWFWEK